MLLLTMTPRDRYYLPEHENQDDRINRSWRGHRLLAGCTVSPRAHKAWPRSCRGKGNLQ